MTKKYHVQFSEEDLFHLEGNYGRMYATCVPTPLPGHFLVKTDGVFEITKCSYSLDGHYEVNIQPVMSQCEDNDAIIVMNKDRLYKCVKNEFCYGFKRVTLLSLLDSIEDLAAKVTYLKDHVCSSEENNVKSLE